MVPSDLANSESTGGAGSTPARATTTSDWQMQFLVQHEDSGPTPGSSSGLGLLSCGKGSYFSLLWLCGCRSKCFHSPDQNCGRLG